MIAYLNGTIKAIDENKFTEKESGDEIAYSTIFIQSVNEDGQFKTEAINTKIDARPFIDKAVTIQLNIVPDFEHKKLKRVSVIDITETDEL